jgi:hypothetical protein
VLPTRSERWRALSFIVRAVHEEEKAYEDFGGTEESVHLMNRARKPVQGP